MSHKKQVRAKPEVQLVGETFTRGPGPSVVPETRMVAPVAVADGCNPDGSAHWSACPQCGASKLSTRVLTPACSETGDRVRTREGWGRVKFMICRNQDCPGNRRKCARTGQQLPPPRYKVVEPD